MEYSLCKKRNAVDDCKLIKYDLEELNHVNQELSMLKTDFNHNIRQYNKDLNYLENMNNRYWASQNDYYHIENNEARKYSNLKCDEDNLLDHINNSNYPYGLWRYKKKYYYRPTPETDFSKGTIEEISKDISSRYPMSVHSIPDLNNIPNNIKEIKFDTVFISEKAIPVIEDEIIDIKQKYEIFQDINGLFYRNLLVNTKYLKSRFKYHYIDSNKSTKARLFIQKMTTFKDSLFLLNRLGRFIKTLQGENLIVMVGNKNISKDILWEKILTPMLSPENYITLTCEILEKMSIEEILKGKILIYIDEIPQEHKHKEKLKELFIRVLINKSFQIENKITPTYAQIIITLDEPEPFIKDFQNLSDIFYINSKEEVLLSLNTINDISLIKNIKESLLTFSEELSAIGIHQFNTPNYSSGNKKFLLGLDEIEGEIDFLSDIGLPILDPDNDSFERYFPMGESHTYITGLTRIGKSSFLITLFVRYIQNKNSNVILFDVHGDCAKKAKMLVKDKERILYISNSLDKSYAASINLFKIDDKSEQNIRKIANIILGVLKQIKVDETFTGPMEEGLLRCIRVLLRKGDGDFHELYRFMNDKRNADLVKYAKKCGNPLDEEYFSDYFNDTNTKNAIRRRLATLLNDEDFMNMMSGDKSIDFEKEFNTPGKIIIIDIAKGDMDSYVYYIRFIVEYILVLSLKRVNTLKEERVMTHLILDEFDNFITSNGNIKTILKEAGKYNLFLTIAHQIISDIKDPSLRDTVLSMTDAKIIFKNSNQTLDALNKTLNTKLDDVENLNKGECYVSVANSEIIKCKNTTKFLDDSEEISDVQWEEHKQYQLTKNYRPLTLKTSQPTEEELNEMIKKFKNDFKLKNLTETSCIQKLEVSALERFEEIKSDFEHLDTAKNIKRSRIRQKEFSKIFQLVFELNDVIENRKFIQMLKAKDEDDMFNQSSHGVRIGNFTDDGKTQTEQYYYFEW